MMAVIEIIKAIQGKTDELRKALQAIVPLCQNEEGCFLYELFEPIGKEGEFLVLMKWKDRQSLARHEKSRIIEEFVKRYDGILFGEVTQTEWNPSV